MTEQITFGGQVNEQIVQTPVYSAKYKDVDYSREFTLGNQKKNKKIYVEHFKIKAINCCMTLRIRGIESIMKQKNVMSVFLNLGSNFADITDADFNYTEMEIIKQQLTDETINTDIIKHYYTESMQQFYQIFGSQDIIGNPLSFIANVGKGTDTFYNEPLEGLVDRNYSRATVGFFNSIMGILSNTTLALANSGTGMFGSIYLCVRNLFGAKLTHAQLDRPLTVSGGV